MSTEKKVERRGSIIRRVRGKEEGVSDRKEKIQGGGGREEKRLEHLKTSKNHRRE